MQVTQTCVKRPLRSLFLGLSLTTWLGTIVMKVVKR